jgi:hypothetical protein
MAIYQNKTVTDAKVEVGNYAIYVGNQGTTVGGAWVNLGAGMLKDFAYVAENYTSQSGNSVDPITGISRETATFSFDLLEYDGSSFSAISGGAITGTTGSLLVGGQTTVITPKGFKLINIRKLASGSNQTTTFVINKCTLQNGWTMTPKSDNDTDPVNVYSFSVLAEQYATDGTIFVKTVG